jgi:hypothetical protein
MGQIMSEAEALQVEYRRLARKVIYAAFDGPVDAEDEARLELMRNEVLRQESIGGGRLAQVEGIGRQE